MSFFKNLNVKSKLTLILVVFILIASIISYKGIETSSQLNDEISYIIDNNVPRIELSNEVIISLISMQRAEKNVILADTQESMEKYIQLFRKSEEKFNNTIEKLKKVSSEKGKELLNECLKTQDEYSLVSEKIFQLSLAQNSKDAMLLSQNESRKIIDNCEDVLSKVIELNRKLLEEKDAQTTKLYETSRNLIFSISIIGHL